MLQNTTPPTIDQLLAMSEEQLAEIWYEKTDFWVTKKIVSVKSDADRLTQLDLSPRAILERECLSTSLDAINKYLNLWEHGLVAIDEIHDDYDIANINGGDRIFVLWMDAHWNKLEIIFHVLYHLQDDETIEIFRKKDEWNIVSTSLLRSKAVIHKKFTKDELVAMCKPKKPTKKLVEQLLEVELENNAVFEEKGNYYRNGYEVTDELDF